MTFFTLFQKISTAGSSARWYKKTHFPQIPLKFLEIYEWILRKHFFCDFPKKVNMHSGVMVWMRFSWKCCTWTFSCQRSFTIFKFFNSETCLKSGPFHHFSHFIFQKRCFLCFLKQKMENPLSFSILFFEKTWNFTLFALCLIRQVSFCRRE